MRNISDANQTNHPIEISTETIEHIKIRSRPTRRGKPHTATSLKQKKKRSKLRGTRKRETRPQQNRNKSQKTEQGREQKTEENTDSTTTRASIRPKWKADSFGHNISAQDFSSRRDTTNTKRPRVLQKDRSQNWKERKNYRRNYHFATAPSRRSLWGIKLFSKEYQIPARDQGSYDLSLCNVKERWIAHLYETM